MLVIKHCICLPAFPWHKWHPSLLIRFTTLFSKEIKPVNPKGNQSWILIGRTDTKAEAPRLGPPDTRWLTGKDSDAGKDWRQEEKRVTEDETVGWHHRFNGHELGQTLGDCEGQGGLVCCSPGGHKESDMTWWLNNNNTTFIHYSFDPQTSISDCAMRAQTGI